MKKIVIVVCQLLVVASCSNNSRRLLALHEVDRSRIEIVDSLFLPQENVHKTSVFVVSDTVLFVENDDSRLEHGDDMYYFFDLTKGEYKPFLKYGNGALLSSTSCRNGDEMLIYDFIKHDVYAFSLESIVKQKHPNISKSVVDFSCQYLLPYKDSSFIFLNPLYFPLKNKQFPSQRNQLCLSDGTHFDFPNNYKYDYFNVTRGFFIINWYRDRLVYFDAYYHRIDFYSTSLEHLLTLEDPSQDVASYTIINYNEKVQGPVFSSFIPETFLDVAYNKDYIYVAYSGQVIIDDFRREIFQSIIYKLTWDGVFVASYDCNLHVKSLSSSPTNSAFLYIFGQDDTDHYSLLKCVLP